MTITQYLGTGAQSRGRLTINKLLNMQATTSPYLRNDVDKAAVIAGLEKVQGYFKSISNLTWIRPAPNETATHYVNSVSGMRLVIRRVSLPIPGRPFLFFSFPFRLARRYPLTRRDRI